jgi:hypothetical protein
MYGVGQVKGRVGVRIHAANLPAQLAGCISLGERLGSIEGKKAVLLSSPAVRRFEMHMQRKPFLLEVRDV